MTRTKLADRQLPDYTKGEEIFNSASHYLGTIFGIVAFILCLKASNTVYDYLGSFFYGICTIFMYTLSGTYHGITAVMPKKVLQIIDHCGVFLMVAGSYSIVMICGLRRTMPILSWVMFGVVWGFTILGIILNSIDLKKYHIFSLVTHIVTGWSVVLVIYPVVKAVGFAGAAYIVGGGIAYTIGSVLYAKGPDVRYFHSVFHVFVLVGSVLQFVGIINYFF